MNKKLLTAFLFGASVLASTSTFVSCKDYDDDIKAANNKIDAEITARKALEEKVAAAQAAITAIQAHEADCDKAQAAALEEAKKALQAAIDAQADKEAKDVVALNAAIDKALIDAKAYTDAAIAISEGKTDAKLADINSQIADILAKCNSLSDEITAVKGEYSSLKAALDAQKAKLEEYADQAAAAAAKKACDELKTYVDTQDKALDKKIDEAVAEVNKKIDAMNATIDDIKTDLKIALGDIKDIKENIKTIEADIKDNVKPAIEALDAKLYVIDAILSKKLRSLVFMPTLYVDGIEAIRYRVLVDTALIATDPYTIYRQRDFMPYKETHVKAVTNLIDYIEPKSKPEALFFGPIWPVQYHLNPSTAPVVWGDLYTNPDCGHAFYVRDADVITRSASDKLAQNTVNKSLNVSSPQFYPCWDKNGNPVPVFKNEKGILTVGIQVGNPKGLFDGEPNTVINHNAELSGDAKPTVDDNRGTYESATGHYSNGVDQIVALQAKSMLESSKTDTVITSDYAMLYGTKVFLEGIVWQDAVGKTNSDGKLDDKFVNSPYSTHEGSCDEWYYDPYGLRACADYAVQDKSAKNREVADPHVDPAVAAAQGRIQYRCKQHKHVWDSPEEALLYDDNLVQIQYDNKNQDIKLDEWLALHWYEENVNRTDFTAVQQTNFTADADIWNKYGLYYDFEFVDYEVDGNLTRDSRYAYWAEDDAEKANMTKYGLHDYIANHGHIKAGNVDKDGSRITEVSKASVDREPLVRVVVKHQNTLGKKDPKNDKVLLDGYILCHITETVTTEKPVEKTIPFKGSATFDLCNDQMVLSFDWATFSKVVLADSLGIEKGTFDDFFGAAKTDATVSSLVDANGGVLTYADLFQGAADGDWANATWIDEANKLNGVKFYANLYATKTSSPNVGTYGKVVFYTNVQGTTNNVIRWYLTAEEMEQITHNDKKEGTKKVYIRFTGKENSKWKYLWFELETTIKRINVAEYKITEKDINYWYDENPDGKTMDVIDQGLSAVLLNVDNPLDGRDCATWTQSLRNNFVMNQVFLETKDKTGKWVLADTLSTIAGCTNADHKSLPTYSNITTEDRIKSSNDVDSDVKGDYSALGDANKKIDGQVTKTHIAQGAKFYFTGDTSIVKVSYKHGEVEAYNNKGEKVKVITNTGRGKTVDYVITPYDGKNSTWNKLIPRYSTHHLSWCNEVATDKLPKNWCPDADSKTNYKTRYNSEFPGAGNYFDAHDNDAKTPGIPECVKEDAAGYEWKSEENANKIVNKCAIDYNKGVYNNDKLYAYNPDTKKYTLIATLDQQSGQLTLKHYNENTERDDFNTVCDVLNAIGYNETHQNINDELHHHVGVIAKTACELATQMNDATWLLTWQRPINLDPMDNRVAVDANTNANKLYLADFLKLYDYRGPVKGDMTAKENVWLWAYYNIHYIVVDCNPEHVKTNLHTGGTWTTMDHINPQYARVYADSLRNYVHKYDFDLRNVSYERNFNCGHNEYPGYHDINNASWSKCGKSNIDFDYASRSEQLWNIFHSDPYTYVSKTGKKLSDGTFELSDLKATFGYIYYDNNKDNVTEFDVIIPITIGYEWGCFTEEVKVHIVRTEGNAKKR